MTILFCKKCHKEAGRIVREDPGNPALPSGVIKVMQGKTCLISMPATSTGNSINIKCPAGHSVPVRLE